MFVCLFVLQSNNIIFPVTLCVTLYMPVCYSERFPGVSFVTVSECKILKGFLKRQRGDDVMVGLLSLL